MLYNKYIRYREYVKQVEFHPKSIDKSWDDVKDFIKDLKGCFWKKSKFITLNYLLKECRKLHDARERVLKKEKVKSYKDTIEYIYGSQVIYSQYIWEWWIKKFNVDIQCRQIKRLNNYRVDMCIWFTKRQCLIFRQDIEKLKKKEIPPHDEYIFRHLTDLSSCEYREKARDALINKLIQNYEEKIESIENRVEGYKFEGIQAVGCAMLMMIADVSVAKELR